MLATLAAASLTNHQPCSPGTTAGGLLPSHFVKFRTLPSFSCSNLYSGRDTPCRRTHITRLKRFLSLACICSALIAATDALTIESRAIGDVYSLYEYLSGQDLTGAAQEKLATLACRKGRRRLCTSAQAFSAAICRPCAVIQTSTWSTIPETEAHTWCRIHLLNGSPDPARKC